MMKLADLRDAIASSTPFLDNRLICEVLHLAGCETKEHNRYWRRLGMRRIGHDSHWTSVPDFGKFDNAHRFLIDRSTRVVSLYETVSIISHPYKDSGWRCLLNREGDVELIYQGNGQGISAGHALTAAWVDLQLNRSKR